MYPVCTAMYVSSRHASYLLRRDCNDYEGRQWKKLLQHMMVLASIGAGMQDLAYLMYEYDKISCISMLFQQHQNRIQLSTDDRIKYSSCPNSNKLVMQENHWI